MTAIIDGMGSCGAALGPVLTGHLVTLRGGFDNVFLMLYIAAAAAGLLLSKLAYKEVSLIHCCIMQNPCLRDNTSCRGVQQQILLVCNTHSQ